MSYAAIVARVHTRKHPGADRLQLGTVAGSQVVVDLETQDGELGIFFPCDGQLSHEMCEANSLYTESAYRELMQGHTCPTFGECWCELPAKYGFFSIKRRVRAQKFRGEKSDGYWVGVQALAWTGYDVTLLKEGDQITELNGQPVCNKYFSPATLRAMKEQGNKNRKKERDAVFPLHPETPQFRYFTGSIPADSIIYLSEKVHGTSSRLGHVLETLGDTRTRWQRVVDYLTMRTPAPETQWTYLNGSRRVCLEKSNGAGYYGTDDFRYDVVAGIELHKGEILYGEIAGYVEPGQLIMQAQELKDKALVKQFKSNAMTYTYGCADGEHRLFIYRITRLNADGVETELSWPAVVGRCQELGLQTVPLLHAPIVYRGAADTEALVALVEQASEGLSTIDERHIREGVVVRVESASGISRYKCKQFLFGVLEGYIKDQDEVVDMEEAA